MADWNANKIKKVTTVAFRMRNPPKRRPSSADIIKNAVKVLKPELKKTEIRVIPKGVVHFDSSPETRPITADQVMTAQITVKWFLQESAWRITASQEIMGYQDISTYLEPMMDKQEAQL